MENGKQTPTKSEIAKTFLEYYGSFHDCTLKEHAETVCNKCMDDYVVLSNFYESISNANERIGICIDLDDLVRKNR